MNQFIWEAFITLLIIVDPLTICPVFISLTHNENRVEKIRTAGRACLIGIILTILFAFIGRKLLDILHISEHAFRIAGGFLFLYTAFGMVLASGKGMKTPTTAEEREAETRQDVSVFPLAIPMIAGPGVIVSVVVLMKEAETIGYTAQTALIGVIIVTIAISYFTMRASDKVMRILGLTGTNVLTRVFGIILTALAVQHIINGLVPVLRQI